MTVFSFGYHGWGNATDRLIQSVDAVERDRGFEPPRFVDIRIRRQGRAVGFVGQAFEKLLGGDRHLWMPRLGNRRIVTRSGPAIQIAEPQAANELLDAALAAEAENRRILFFCSCEFPMQGEEVACHRAAVAELLVQAAQKRREPVEVVEWPGGDPEHLAITAPLTVIRAVRRGRSTIPVDDALPLARIASLPWATIATLASGGETLHRMVGPARWRQGEWRLPVLSRDSFEPNSSLEAAGKAAAIFRQDHGMTPLRAD
jgi:hypothetical protein